MNNEYTQILIAGNLNAAWTWVEENVSLPMIDKRLGMAKIETVDYYTLDFFKRVSSVIEKKFEVWSIGKPGQDAMTELRKDVTTLLNEVKRLRLTDLVHDVNQEKHIFGRLPAATEIIPKGLVDVIQPNRDADDQAHHSEHQAHFTIPSTSIDSVIEPATKKRKLGGDFYNDFD